MLPPVVTPATLPAVSQNLSRSSGAYFRKCVRVEKVPGPRIPASRRRELEAPAIGRPGVTGHGRGDEDSPQRHCACTDSDRPRFHLGAKFIEAERGVGARSRLLCRCVHDEESSCSHQQEAEDRVHNRQRVGRRAALRPRPNFVHLGRSSEIGPGWAVDERIGASRPKRQAGQKQARGHRPSHNRQGHRRASFPLPCFPTAPPRCSRKAGFYELLYCLHGRRKQDRRHAIRVYKPM